MKTLLLVPLCLALYALPSRGDRAAAGAPAGEHDWVVDPVHSSVVFKIKHIDAAWFKGTFDEITGTMTLDPAEPEAGRVELKIPVASLDTNNGQRDEHLKSADFFHQKENPEITFRSTQIQRGTEALSVTGDLSFAGKTRSITIPVAKVGEGEMQGKRIGYTTTFTIQRSDFDMSYGIAEKMLDDEVTLMIDLELMKPQ